MQAHRPCPFLDTKTYMASLIDKMMESSNDGCELRTVGAFQGLVKSPHGHQSGNPYRIPDEPALRSFDRRSAITLGARAARALRSCSIRRIENDAVGGACRNNAHVILDGDAQRPACALNDQFLRAQNRHLSNGWLVGVRGNNGGR